jgi:hypothetical protein
MVSRKFYTLLFFIGCAGFILFPSCKKKNNSSGSLSTASMKFMDSAFQFTGVSATMSGNAASISGTDVTKSIGLIMLLRRPLILNDTLDLDSAGDNIQLTITGYPSIWGAGFGKSPGDAKLTITSWDSVGHRLSGSFSGVVTAAGGYSDTLSAGKFDVEYTVE